MAAPGCLPPGTNVFVAAPTRAVRSPVDIIMVTTMALAWTVNSTLSRGCNYVMHPSCNASANSPEAAKFQNSIFLPLQMPPLHSAARGECPPPLPPSFPPPLRFIRCVLNGCRLLKKNSSCEIMHSVLSGTLNCAPPLRS